MCTGRGSGWATIASWADTVSTASSGAALGLGVAALATSETGVGLVSFGGAAGVAEGVSVLSSGVAVVAKAMDGNYGGAGLSAVSATLGAGSGALLEKFGSQAVAAGLISARRLQVLQVGVSGDAMLNDQLLKCQGS